MKILEVCRVWKTHLMGGMPIAAHYHAFALKRLGHEVIVATTAHQDYGECRPYLDGIPIYHLPCNPMAADSLFSAQLTSFYDRMGGFDVVHSHSGGGAALIGKAPIVLTLHGYCLENTFNDMALYLDTGEQQYIESAKQKLENGIKERELFKRFDVVTALSVNTHHDLMAKMQLPNVVYIPNGIDTDLFKPMPAEYAMRVRNSIGMPSDAVMILVACHLTHYKGVHHLIEAMPKVLERIPNAHVVICGEGPDLGMLKQMAVDNGTSHRVHFVGEVDNYAMPGYYNAADVFFSGSYHYSGLDMNLVEACACKCPVVACVTPGKLDLGGGIFYYTLEKRDDISELVEQAAKYRDAFECSEAHVIARSRFGLQYLGETLEILFNQIRS